MKKREIIETVNKVRIWEKDSKLLDLLVQDGRRRGQVCCLAERKRRNQGRQEKQGISERFNARVCLSVPPTAIQRDRPARV